MSKNIFLVHRTLNRKDPAISKSKFFLTLNCRSPQSSKTQFNKYYYPHPQMQCLISVLVRAFLLMEIKGELQSIYHTNIKPWLATLKMKGVVARVLAALRFQHSILDPPNKEENFQEVQNLQKNTKKLFFTPHLDISD